MIRQIPRTDCGELNSQTRNLLEVPGIDGENGEAVVQCGRRDLQVVCPDVVALGAQVRPYLSVDTSHTQVECRILST